MHAIRTFTNKHQFQSGQALVIIALAMVGLFGFTALALDGGMLYSERRRAQNAADTGALAAALAKINGVNLHVTALQRIDSNGFGTTWGACDPAGYDCTLGTAEKWTVEVSNPPRHGDFAGDSDYIQVIITTEVKSSFAHLVFSGPLRTTVEAVSRVRPPVNIAPGHALYASTDHDCKGVWFTGTGDTTVTGGSVFSNSDASSGSCQSGVSDGSGAVSVGNPYKVMVVGTFDDGGGSVDPPPTEGVPPEELFPVPTPDCSGLPNDYGNIQINAGEEVTLDEGRYEQIKFQADATVTLNPGMYCIYGNKGFTGLGGSISGDGIMIYMQNGPFDLGGNTEVDLNAEQSDGVLVDPSLNDWKGMLLYVDPGNTSTIKITGGSDSSYTGTIYAPTSYCTLEGTGTNLGLNSQLICDKVKIAGTANLSITYNEDNNFSLPPAIDLAR
jgi:hypothetical protein